MSVETRTMAGAPAERWAVEPVLAVIVAIGFGLRLAAARGDLWFDEIWSLDLISRVPSALGVFTIAHDNNHVLNSLWLYAVGPDAPVWLMRLPAVLFGTVSVVVAAWIGARRSPATGIVTALLAAIAYPLVHYGSEARGYAGLILAYLVAVDAFLREMDAPSLRHRLILGAAIGIGTLFHLTMLAGAAVLGLTAVCIFLRGETGTLHGRILRAIDLTLTTFRPALVALIPALAAVAAGLMLHGRFEIGGLTSFAPERFALGFGGMMGMMLGLPQSLPAWLICAAVVIGASVACASSALDRNTRLLYAIAILVLPAALFLARVPNTEFPRHFLVPGITLILMAGELAGRLWENGRTGRIAAAALMMLFAVGQASRLADFYRLGRGDYTSLVAEMTRAGPALYGSNHPFKNHMLVDHFARILHVRAAEVPQAQWCERRPGWYIAGADQMDVPPAEITLGPETCRVTFKVVSVHPFSGLSGWQWTLYRAQLAP